MIPNKCCIFLFVLTLTRQTARLVDGSSNSTLKYKQFSYSIYEPGWSLESGGALEVWFKTGVKNAMLVYEDNDSNEFLDVFLVEGRVRMRIAAWECSAEERLINGSFSDFKWHKLVIRKESENVTLSVDGTTAEPFQCSSEFDSMPALYTGYLSPFVNPAKVWVSPSSQWQSTVPTSFQGCIKSIQYTENEIVTRPQLRTTSGTELGCSSPCWSLRCRHGGRCVDRIMTAWCDCEGTGYHGKHCARVIRETSTKPPSTLSPTTEKITPKVKDTNQATPSPKEMKVSKSQRKSLGVYHCVDLMVVTIITALGLAVAVCNVA